MGILARRLEEHPRPAGARREPSLQLSGRPGGREVDLPAPQARGVGLAGRLTGVDGPQSPPVPAMPSPSVRRR